MPFWYQVQASKSWVLTPPRPQVLHHREATNSQLPQRLPKLGHFRKVALSVLNFSSIPPTLRIQGIWAPSSHHTPDQCCLGPNREDPQGPVLSQAWRERGRQGGREEGIREGERRETEKQRDTKRPQWNRMKNPEINSCIN